VTRPLGSTYRLQLADVGFGGARQMLDYLAALGIETLYVSPVLAAVPGSPHGYDVIDPGRLDPALGTQEEFDALVAELVARGMRMLIDIVPNHMAADLANRWWADVLRRGRSSEHADTFDIDWSVHGGRVLLPVLSAPLAEVLETAEWADGPDRGLRLDGVLLPLRPESVAAGSPQEALATQHYRPAFWKLGAREGNYRRFFDIDGLVGIRVEDPRVFDRTHRFLGQLAGQAGIAGWRVDHIDGLADPRRYLDRLRALVAPADRDPPLVVVEKVLARDESIPQEWPVDGTSGYEFADLAGGLFVSAAGLLALGPAAHQVAEAPETFAALGDRAKREVMATSFYGPLHRLGRLVRVALDATNPGHDLAHPDVRAALVELTAGLDVYRTYRDDRGVDEVDRTRILAAETRARGRALGPEVSRALSLLVTGLTSAHEAWREATQRWQQLSGAVMAKAVEDTATYRSVGLLSHAEVGGDPDAASATPEQFHALVRRRQRLVASLNATSTHDSKRSEDARARLFALSERPRDWNALVARWHGRFCPDGEGLDISDERRVYQSLLALWPSTSAARDAEDPGDHAQVRVRVGQYAIKAAREAKLRTAWVDGDERYERGLTGFVDRVVGDHGFGVEMGQFVEAIGPAALTNSLAMVVLKSIAPGVPDFYQGTELWQTSLTDPDNRRPVDFAARREALARLGPVELAPQDKAARAAQALEAWPDGSVKLLVTRALLHLRRAHPQLFAEGTYHVLDATGLGDHIVAIARHHDQRWVLAVVPRLTARLVGAGRFATGRQAWGQAAVTVGPCRADIWRDVLTGATVKARAGVLPLAECLAILPVAVLVA
jgi:(1->4)-alpha-D-glucan 1-alpha-D-glucosylmutase